MTGARDEDQWLTKAQATLDEAAKAEPKVLTLDEALQTLPKSTVDQQRDLMAELGEVPAWQPLGLPHHPIYDALSAKHGIDTRPHAIVTFFRGDK